MRRFGRLVYTFPLRLRSLFRRKRVESELNEELRYHLERIVDDNIAKGMAAEEARYQALRSMDGIEQQKEHCRDARRVNFFENLIQDLQYGFRTLRKSHAFAAAAVLTLALGVGANTTVFTLVNTLIFAPLPYSDGTRLIRIFRTSPQSSNWPHSVPSFLAQRSENSVLEKMAAFTWTNFTLTLQGEPAERLTGFLVTSDYWPLLGVKPMVGRVFGDDEDRPGAAGVVILSHRFWKRRFNGDPNVIGRVLPLNGENVTIAGVMPEDFEHPLLFGPIDLWKPFAFTAQQQSQWNVYSVFEIGRLKPGVSLLQAQSELAALGARIAGDSPLKHVDESLRIEPLQKSMIGDTGRRILWFMFGLAGFVLVMACVNLCNLQLARLTARSREFAVRAALGGGQSRLVQQSLTESFLIAAFGTAGAFPIAIWSQQWIASRFFGDFPGAHSRFDGTVFAFALLSAVGTAVVFGSIPAWLASRVNLNGVLKDAPRLATARQAHTRLRYSLIVGQIVFAIVVLTGAALFGRGLYDLTHVDTGWRPDGLVFGQIELTGSRYKQAANRAAFFDMLQQRMKAMPGVLNTSISWSTPIFGFQNSKTVTIADRTDPPFLVFNEAASPQYFETLGIRLVQGRTFTDADTMDRPDVVIINEAFAKHYWPNESPIGKRIVNRGEQQRCCEIVGVVGDVRFPANLNGSETTFQMYRPLLQVPGNSPRIELRTSGTVVNTSAEIRSAVAEIDPSLAVSDIQTASMGVEHSFGDLSAITSMTGTFAALALALAAIGIYGVIAYTAAHRTGEIGIRLALGAGRSSVLWMIMRQGLTLGVAGSALGLVGAYAFVQLMASAIPAVPSGDAVTLGIVALTLISVALLASWLPARRASRTDPLTALRHE